MDIRLVFAALSLLVGVLVLVTLSMDGILVRRKMRTAKSPESRHLQSMVHKERTDNTVTHIAFLKVHKTGSSTIQNLLFRFGIRRNLTFVIPQTGNYFSSEGNQHVPILPIPADHHYDILCYHAVFNNETFSKFLPSDAEYFGMLRNPVSQLISAAYYYKASQSHLKYAKRLSGGDFIRNLIRYSKRFDNELFSLTRNSMAKDFGFSESHVPAAAFRQYLDFLDKRFKLVLITERFDESLVLMKRLLHWTTQDILYLPNNVYTHWKNDSLTDEDITLLQARNFMDFNLYDFFDSRLKKQISAEGPGFHVEVADFKQCLQSVAEFCNPFNPSSVHEAPASNWNERFIVTKSDCYFMKLRALNFQQKMLIRHQKMMSSANRTGS